MATATVPPPLRHTANPAPVRPANSVRRTCTIDVSWPEGHLADRLFIGRVRDYRTPADGGAGEVLDAAEFRARLAEDKTINAIEAEPAPERLDTLVGVRGGNHLRLFIKQTMPELIERAAPIYLPLDDISGTALVSAFAWSQFHDNWSEQFRQRIGEEEFERLMESRIDICWGLARGNSGVAPGGPQGNPAEADAGDIRNPADPLGWHELPENKGPGFRRARRIDVTRDDAAGLIRIEAAFQDSAKRRTEGRVAIHEYTIRATADMASGKLLSLTPEPHVLPFGECPGAVANAQRLVGLPLADLRDAVIANLKGTAGCTHLNDALRSLAEVPKLVQYLG
ncbi:MAG TPA: DUF2889 domain-containing protein [Novosphingobium sp.]|nr:DUF2889 domain-containing protein [Novosphingobium sp.]